MADLTATEMNIPRPQHGAVEPMSPTTILGGVLNTGTSVLEGVDRLRYNNMIDQRETDKAVESDLAAKTFNTTLNANNEIAGVPQSTVAGTQKLNTIQSGVSQGVLPQAAYQTQLQNIYSQEIAANPKSADAIVAYARQNGHEATMFQQLDAQQANQKALQTGYDQSQAFGVDFAQKNGVPPGLPLRDQAKYGLELSFARDQQQQAAQAAQAAQQSLTMSREQKADAIKQANTDGLTAVQKEYASRTNSIYDGIRLQLSAMDNDPNRDTLIETKLIPAMDSVNAQAKASAHNHLVSIGLGTSDNFKAVDEQIDTQVAGVKAVFADKSGGLQKTLENLKTQYGIDTAKAAPLIFKYGSLIGNNQVAALLGPTTLTNPDLAKQLAQEWSGVAAPGTIDAQQHFSNIISILNGNSQLHDYSEADASRYIGSIVSGQKSSERSILADSSGTQAHRVYLNTTSNVLNAAHQLTPASSLSSLNQATSLTASQSGRTALDKLSNDPLVKEYSASVGMASHLTSIKLLQNFQQHAPEGVNQYQKIQYDPTSGQFQVKFDKDSFQSDPSNRGADPRILTQRGFAFSKVSQAAQTQVDSMNALLDHAVKTGKYDTDLPKTATPLQVRTAIATGTPLKGKEQSADEKWNASEKAIEDRLSQLPQVIQGQDAARDQSQRASQGIYGAIQTVESGNNPNAQSSAGAQGLMQVMPATLKNPGFGIEPAKDNSPEENQRVGRQVFDAYKNKYGSDALALAAYNWGPGNTDKWISEGGNFQKLPAETQKYISNVLLHHALKSGYAGREQ